MAHLTSRGLSGSSTGAAWRQRSATNTCTTFWPVQRAWHARRALLNTDSVDFGEHKSNLSCAKLKQWSPALNMPKLRALKCAKLMLVLRCQFSYAYVRGVQHAGNGMEFSARAAVLGMQPDDFKQVVAVIPAAAYMEPTGQLQYCLCRHTHQFTYAHDRMRRVPFYCDQAIISPHMLVRSSM